MGLVIKTYALKKEKNKMKIGKAEQFLFIKKRQQQMNEQTIDIVNGKEKNSATRAKRRQNETEKRERE